MAHLPTPLAPSARSAAVPADNRIVSVRPGRARRATAGCPGSPFSCTSIGTVSPTNTETYTGSSGSLSALTISGGSDGINDSTTARATEGFAFIYAAETSDFSLSGDLQSQPENGSATDSTGIMVRGSLATPSANYYAYFLPPNAAANPGALVVDYTATSGGSPVNLAAIGTSSATVPGSSGTAATCSTAPSAGSCYLAVDRRTLPDGSVQLETYFSIDGSHFQAVWGSTVTLASTSALYDAGYAGIAATSDSYGNATTSTLASVVLASTPVYDEIGAGAECPPSYTCQPVGSSVQGGQWATPGNAWSSSTWTVSGAGTGLVSGATSDGLQFVPMPLNGSGSVSATLDGYEFPTPTANYGVAQYGIMERGSTSSSAPFFASVISPCQGVGTAYRSTSGGAITLTWNTTPPTCNAANEEAGFGPTASIGLEVVRSGNSFQAYENTGSGFTSYGSAETISAIPSQAPAGVFASSTITGWQAWANFTNVLVSGDEPTAQEQIGGGGSAFMPSSGYTGDFSQSSSDISESGGRGLPLGFTRTYNSLLASEPAATLSPYGNLGPGWMDNYDLVATADTAGDVTIQQASGSQITFVDSAGTYTTPTHILDTLQVNAGQTLAPNCPATALVLTTHDQTIYAFYEIQASPPATQPSGALCEELNLNGYPTELTYDSSSRLTTVTAYTDFNGTSFDVDRYLTLAYSGAGTQIVSVTSSANTGTGTLEETYGYTSGNLTSATNADGDETRYTYNNEGLLSAIRTPNQYAAGSSGTAVTYDTSGRVRYTQDPAAVAAGENAVASYGYQCSVSASTCASDGTQTTTAIGPLGNETQEVFVDGMMTAQTQGVGTSSAATTNFSYDQNTLGVTTATQPANGSGASYEISYTNWFGTGSGSFGNVQCSVAPGNPGSTYALTGASQTSGTATLTFATSTAPVVGATIVVTGVSNSAYDGTLQVTAASTTSVSYAVSGSPGSSSGGSFYQIQGAVSSDTYNSYNEPVTSTNADEQAVSYNGACNSGTATYLTTNYYGSAGSGACAGNAPDAWLLACTVEDTGGTPASPTTNYGYTGTASGGGADDNVGDVTSTTDANGNTTVSAYDTYGDVTDTYAPGRAGYSISLTSEACASGTVTLTYPSTTAVPASGSDIVVSNASVTGYDGNWSAAATGTGTTVTYSIGTCPGSSGTGGSLLIAKPVSIVTGASWSSGSGGQATIAFASMTAPWPGTQVTIAGVSPSGYNGTETVVSSTSTSVTYALGSSPGAYTSGGTFYDLQPSHSNTAFEPDGQSATTTEPNGYAPLANSALWTAASTYDAQGNLTQQTGMPVANTGDTCSTSTLKLNFTAGPVDPPVGSKVIVGGNTDSDYNGTFSVTTVAATYIKVNVGSCSGSSSGGTFAGFSTTTYDGDGNAIAATSPNDGTTGTRYDLDDQDLADSDPGTSLKITSGSCSAGVVTVGYSSASVYPVAGSDVFINGVSPSNYNGYFVVNGTPTSTSTKYNDSGCSGSWSSGGLLSPSASLTTYDGDGNEVTSADYGDTTETTDYAYDPLNRQIAATVPGSSLATTGGSWSSGSGGVATLDYSSATQYPVAGSYILVQGVSPSGYDGVFEVATSGSTSLTYDLATNPGSYSTAGSLASAGYTSYYASGATDETVDPSGSVDLTTDYPGGRTYQTTTGYGSGSPQTETTTYDAAGNTLTDETASETTTNTYNDVNWRLTTTDANGNESSYTYDDLGNVTEEADPGASLAVTGGSWASSVATLDFATNTAPSVQGTITVTGVTPSGYNGTYAVTASSSTSVSYALGTSPGSYTSGGSIAVPVVTHSSYDSANRLTSSCTDGVPTGSLCGGSPASVSTASGVYDADGNAIAATDGSSSTGSSGTGNVWQTGEEADTGGSDQSEEAVSPSSQDTSSGYDADGNTATVTNNEGNTATYTFDTSNRVTNISYSDGSTHSVAYTYNPDGTVATMVDGSGTTTYAYNQQGQLSSVTDGNGNEMQYGWNAAGQLATVEYPDGNVATYTYNALGQMASVADWLGSSGGTTDFTYDSAGSLATVTPPNGTVTTYSYDSDENMNKIATAEGGDAQFSFDATGSNGSLNPDGTVQKFTTSQPATGEGSTNYELSPGSKSSAGSDTYSYDQLSRMAKDSQGGSTSGSFTYNDNGEISSDTGASSILPADSGTSTFVSGSAASGTDAGEVTKIGSGDYFTYNADGDRTCESSATGCTGTKQSYGFDEEDRMTSYTDTAGDVVDYTYDGNGELMKSKETVSGTCPDILFGDSAKKPVLRGHKARKATGSYTVTVQTAWNTALGGVPTLAYQSEARSCAAIGHTDFIMGPNGEPVEQVYYDADAETWTPDWYYLGFSGDTRELLGKTASVDATYNYPPYGKDTSWVASVDTSTPLQYVGTYVDSFTLFTYGKDDGWYDPATAMFVDPDPQAVQTLQPYTYGGDAPGSGGAVPATAAGDAGGGPTQGPPLAKGLTYNCPAQIPCTPNFPVVMRPESSTLTYRFVFKWTFALAYDSATSGLYLWTNFFGMKLVTYRGFKKSGFYGWQMNAQCDNEGQDGEVSMGASTGSGSAKPSLQDDCGDGEDTRTEQCPGNNNAGCPVSQWPTANHLYVWQPPMFKRKWERIWDWGSGSSEPDGVDNAVCGWNTAKFADRDWDIGGCVGDEYAGSGGTGTHLDLPEGSVDLDGE